MLKELVLVYGTLKRGGRFHHALEDQKFVGEDVTADPDFDIIDLGVYPAVVKGDHQIKGEVYEVDDKTRKLLAMIEQEGVLYEAVKVALDSGKYATLFRWLGDVPDYARQTQTNTKQISTNEGVKEWNTEEMLAHA